MDKVPNEIMLQILGKLDMDFASLINLRLVSSRIHEAASKYLSTCLPPLQLSADTLVEFASCFGDTKIWPVSSLNLSYPSSSGESISVIMEFLSTYGSLIRVMSLEPTHEENHYWLNQREQDAIILQKKRLIESLSSLTKMEEFSFDSLPCHRTGCSNSKLDSPLPALSKLKKLTLWYDSHEMLVSTLNSNTGLSHLTLKWSVHEDYGFNSLLHFWNSVLFLSHMSIRQVVELDLCITAHFGPSAEDMDSIDESEEDHVKRLEDESQQEGLDLDVFLERLKGLENGPRLVRLHLKLEFFFCCGESEITSVQSLLEHVKGTLKFLHITYWSSRFHSKHIKHCGSHSFTIPSMPQLESLYLEQGECDEVDERFNQGFLDVSLRNGDVDPFPSLQEITIALRAEAGDIYGGNNCELSLEHMTFESVKKVVLVNFGNELLQPRYCNLGDPPAKRLDEIFPNLTDVTIIRVHNSHYDSTSLWEGQDTLLLHILDNCKDLKSLRIRIQGNTFDAHASLFINVLNGLPMHKVSHQVAQNYVLDFDEAPRRKVESMRTTSILSLPRLEVLELRIPCIASDTVMLTLSQLHPLKELSLFDEMVSSDLAGLKKHHTRYKSLPPFEFGTIKKILSSLV